MNQFEKIITEKEATSHFIADTLKELQASWEKIHNDFKDTFDEKFIIIDEEMALYDLFLAIVAQEMQSIKNLFPIDQANRIEKSIFECIYTKDWGEYAVEEIKRYNKIFQEDLENIKNGSNPITAIPSRLLHKWLSNGIRNLEVELKGKKTGFISPILIQMTTVILVGLGGWWKQIKEQFTLVESY